MLGREIAFSSLAAPSVSPSWSPPLDMVKLNFDDSDIDKLGLVVVGGIIHNSESRCLVSYLGPAGVCSLNNAELLALRTSLRKAYWLNLRL